MILQPTSPLRSAADIPRPRAARTVRCGFGAERQRGAGAIASDADPALDAGGDAVLFVTGDPVRKRINRRQDLPEAWVMNGAIYACRTRVLFADEPACTAIAWSAYRMPAERSISIDDMD